MTKAQSNGIESLGIGGYVSVRVPSQTDANGFVRSVNKYADETGKKFSVYGPKKLLWPRGWYSVGAVRIA